MRPNLASRANSLIFSFADPAPCKSSRRTPASLSRPRACLALLSKGSCRPCPWYIAGGGCSRGTRTPARRQTRRAASTANAHQTPTLRHDGASTRWQFAHTGSPFRVLFTNQSLPMLDAYVDPGIFSLNRHSQKSQILVKASNDQKRNNS